MKVLLSSLLTTLPVKITDDVRELVVQKGQKLLVLDDEITRSLSLRFIVHEDASLEYRFRSIETPTKDTVAELKRTLSFVLVGRGSSASALCLAQTFGSSALTFKTMQHHQAPDTRSSLCIKGVLHDRSRLVSENLIRIEKQAQKVVACEENKNLLFGEHARVISIPKLEVEANDVSCRHGAAISRPTEEMLFYVQSRGLSHKQAEQMLIEAFLSEKV